MGVSLNGGTPKTPQNNQWLLGTTILGNPHKSYNKMCSKICSEISW